MRRQQPIAHLLYHHLFPNPTPNDPPSFAAHLARNLVPEVRIEVATFYGDLNSTEARYPGLNYCYGPHRLRLGRFKHHRRLFDAFDNLGLTYGEIQDFCCWEGTRWARERYEKDEGIKVLDTTGDDIGYFVDQRERKSADDRRRQSITRKTDISVVVEDALDTTTRQLISAATPLDDEMSDNPAQPESPSDDDEEETPAQTLARRYHVAELHLRRESAINQRILAAWENGQSLPPEIEQYLKEQSERGTVVAASNPPDTAGRRRTRGSTSSRHGTASSSRAALVAERAAA